MATRDTVVDYTRKGDADDSRFEVRINDREYKDVSVSSAIRLKCWIDSQYPRVFGGSNYYGGYYKII